MWRSGTRLRDPVGEPEAGRGEDRSGTGIWRQQGHEPDLYGNARQGFRIPDLAGSILISSPGMTSFHSIGLNRAMNPGSDGNSRCGGDTRDLSEPAGGSTQARIGVRHEHAFIGSWTSRALLRPRSLPYNGAGQGEKLPDFDQATAHPGRKLRFGPVLQAEPGLQNASVFPVGSVEPA